MAESPNRRTFLKIVAGTGAIATMIYAPKLFNTPTEIKKVIPKNASETPIPTNKKTSPPEEPSTVEPTKDREVLSLEEWKDLLSDPRFFKEPQGPSKRIILTPQFDQNHSFDPDPDHPDNPDEHPFDPSHPYAGLEEECQYYFYRAHYEGNSCGPAAIATLLKMFTYLKTGDVPDINVAYIINELVGKTYDIQPNSTLMRDKTLELALGYYAEKTGLFRVVTGLTPYWGQEKAHLIPGSQWRGVFENAREQVFNKGGVLIAWVISKDGTGHFETFSSLAGNTKPLIVDSIGDPPEKWKGKGNAQIIELGASCNGFLGAIGVVPTDKLTT